MMTTTLAVLPPSTLRLRDILARPDATRNSADMNLLGFRLHRLKGDLAGWWAVTVGANWRVTFRIEDGNVYDVDLIDYH